MRAYALAKSDFDKAIALMPNNHPGYVMRAWAYHGQEEHKLALRDFSTAIALAPHSPNVYVSRAIGYEAVNDHDRRIADLRHALELEPGSKAIRTYLEHALSARERDLE